MDRTEKIDIKNGKMFVQAESYQGVNVVRISAYDGGWTVFIPASEAVVYCNNFKNGESHSGSEGGFSKQEGASSDKKFVVLRVGNAQMQLSMEDTDSILEFINRASNTIWKS